MPPPRAPQPVLRAKKHFPRYQRNSFSISGIINSNSATASADANCSPVSSRKRSYANFEADSPQAPQFRSREICGGCKLPINHEEEKNSSQESYICDCLDLQAEKREGRKNSWVDGEDAGGEGNQGVGEVPQLKREDAFVAMVKQDGGEVGHSVIQQRTP